MTATPPPNSPSGLAGLINDPSLVKLREAVRSLRRQLSRRILLVDFSDGCAVVAQCRIRRGRADLLPIDISMVPAEALEKGSPTEPADMGALLREVVNERQIVARRAAVVVPAIATTTMPLCLEAELTPEAALRQLGEASSGVQLPFPRQQADMALVDTTDPEAREQHLHRSYMLMAVQRNITDRLVATFEAAGLELQFVDSGLLAPLRLLDREISELGADDQLLHLHLAPGFTSCTVVWRGGPQKQQRLAPVRPYPLIQQPDNDDYFPITPVDLRSLHRDLEKVISESTQRTTLITLGGTGSAHPGLDELLHEELGLRVQVVRPLEHPAVGNFELPAGMNPQAMGRIVGMALRCLRNEDHNGDHEKEQAGKKARENGNRTTKRAAFLHCLKARIRSNIGK